MAKKLLNLTFATEDGSIVYNIGANSTNGLKQNDTVYNSNDKPLMQVGALMYCNGFLKYKDDDGAHYYYEYLYNALTRSGYGQRVVLPSSPLAESYKYYLNGDVNAPYLKYSYMSTNPNWIEIDLYRPDGALVGKLINTPASVEDMLCGVIYEDGTFTGDTVAIRPYWVTVGGKKVFLSNYYSWNFRHHYENVQVISQTTLEYLKSFMPIDPEGEFIPEGVGDLDASSDNIELPDLPTLSAIDTRMLRVYRMTSENLSKFNKFLWSDLFDVNTFKKLFTDPMQAVLNLNISPINVDVLGPSEIKLGNINTGVQGEMCQQQYQRIDFGTIRLNEYWASFADYSPYTRLSIYLPYVGVQSLSIDDVMNGTIQLVGYCDVLTGSILYVLKSNQVNRAGHSHNSVLYSWGGNCQYQIPLTANNMSSVISSITGTTGSVLGAIGATVATGGLTAPIAVGAIGSAVTNTLNAKTQIQRGGGVGGATGMFGVQRPYLILERPEQRTIQDFGGQIGNPADVTDYLGNFSGFVKVKAVHVENVTGATEVEQTEIERLLKDGVII